MKPKLNQAQLQAYYARLQPVITALLDARHRYTDCPTSAMRQFRGLATFVKQLSRLPQGTDYTKYEAQLKRRLVRILHRLYGFQPTPDSPRMGLLDAFPSQLYGDVFERHQQAARAMLRRLSQVDIQANHQPLMRVQNIT